ncbi:SDR family NAD(P)-dependent oxidoreductase [Microbacterium sp. No. 7]|uniref:SDR family NAD(P)-dependent oxidoreductase n=1 Tax=Microbacterium sp. No. 7 TaxID=1714373 RepID=UPI0006D1C367|nr:SDR family oxidoreductase [Microbacterium sp. No. 7]ALJ22299.1 hypothetical protein AOA12_21395 [Microbacterium sp. No. 7]
MSDRRAADPGKKENRMLLDGKRLIVVGGASGAGAAAVRAYAAEGAQVACLDINEDLGRKVVAGLGSGAGFFRCDVTQKEIVDEAIDAAVASMGGLDGVLSTAGIRHEVAAADLTVEEWERMFRSHVLGTVLVNQATFRHLKERGGKIINCGSGVTLRGQVHGSQSGDAHYGAAKAAVMVWTKGIAQEWGRYGITANTVSLSMDTPMSQQMLADMSPADRARFEELLRTVLPLGGKLGDADRDFAPVAVFMASDMSRFISGQVIAVNGGLYMFG